MTLFLLFVVLSNVYEIGTRASGFNPTAVNSTNDSHNLFTFNHGRERRHSTSSIPSLISESGSSNGNDSQDLSELSYDETLTTSKPTEYPTHKPTQHPTKHRTRKPTKLPTAKPTRHPTHYPTTNQPTNAWANTPQNGKAKAIKQKSKSKHTSNMSDDELLRMLDSRHKIKQRTKQSNYTSIKIYSFQNDSTMALLIKFQNEVIRQHSDDLVIVNACGHQHHVYQFAVTLHSFIDIATQCGQQTSARFVQKLNRWFQTVIREAQATTALRIVLNRTISRIEDERETQVKTLNQHLLFQMIQNTFRDNRYQFDLSQVPGGSDVMHLILSFYEYSSIFTVGLVTNWNAYGVREVIPDHDTYFWEVNRWNEMYLAQFKEFINLLRRNPFDRYKCYTTEYQQIKRVLLVFETLFGTLLPYLIAETVWIQMNPDLDENYYRDLHIIAGNELYINKLKTLLRYIQNANGREFKMEHLLVKQNKRKKRQKSAFDLSLI
eukprot:207182_1